MTDRELRTDYALLSPHVLERRKDQRAETALAARRVPAPIDIAAATAELDRLSNPQV